MKSLKRILQWVILAELLFAGMFALSLFVPLPGDLSIKIVQSGSMEPSVPVGSVVAVIPKGSYEVGDVITFGSDTKKKIPTTHRIIDIEREEGSIRYVTKGDANEERDNELVTHSSIIGSVALTVPRLGFVIDFARSKNGFMFMIVIPAFLIMLDEALAIAFAVKGIQREKTVAPVSNGEKRREAIRKVASGLPMTVRLQRPRTQGYSVILRPL